MSSTSANRATLGGRPMGSAESTRRWRERRRQGLVNVRLGPVLTPKLSPSELLLNRVASSVPTPPLRGAACTGKWGLFDPRPSGESEKAAAERHQKAVELCAGCPALAACQAWVEALPARERPLGVVAGRLVDEEVRDA